MLYYVYAACLLYGFWDGYKKITSTNKSHIEKNNEAYSGLVEFLICNNK